MDSSGICSPGAGGSLRCGGGPMSEKSRETLRENDWKVLLRRLKEGTCTPFLGAGACFGILPLGAEIAREWAKDYGYPFEDATDLVRVAQYVSIDFNDGTYPKDLIRDRFKAVAPPNFHELDEPHGLLADLHLPIYVTTNYDDFMAQALTDRHRDPRREVCRWNSRLEGIPSVFTTEPGYRPNAANPIVFHLHGLLQLKKQETQHSLVLTEDDYLEFLTNLVNDEELASAADPGGPDQHVPPIHRLQTCGLELPGDVSVPEGDQSVFRPGRDETPGGSQRGEGARFLSRAISSHGLESVLGDGQRVLCRGSAGDCPSRPPEPALTLIKVVIKFIRHQAAPAATAAGP